MRKIKLNYEQAMEIIASHLESLRAIHTDEHIDIRPFQVIDGNLTVYVQKNKGD